MKRITTVAASAFALTFMIAAFSQTPRPRPTTNKQPANGDQTIAQDNNVEKTNASQRRINSYFHADVVPTLRGCWSGLQGRGTIEIKFTYNKTNHDTWEPAGLAVLRSTLSKPQAQAALQCMQASVHGTSLKVDEGEQSQKSFVINWTWPVPLPANGNEASVMLDNGNGGGGKGGCDGRGSNPSCYVCGTDLACHPSCSGGDSCTNVFSKGRGISCSVAVSCTAGSALGTIGGGGTAF